MRGRLVGIMIGLVVVLTPALWDFSSTAAQSDPIPLPTPASTQTPLTEIWRGVQPTADPSLVPLPRLSDSLPDATATPGYEGERYSPPITPRNYGQEVSVVDFGDEEGLITALGTYETKIIYLLPDVNRTSFKFENTQRLIFYNNVILYGNNAVFEPKETIARSLSLIYISASKTVAIHKIQVVGINNQVAYGGAVVNEGQLTIYDSRFLENKAFQGGAAIMNSGSLTIVRSQFDGNDAGGGAGIQNFGVGEIDITCSRFTNNISNYGSGILNSSPGNGSHAVNVSYSVFANNELRQGAPSANVRDIHNLSTPVVISADYNWWGGDNSADLYHVNINPSLKLLDDPTIPPYNIHPQCQPPDSGGICQANLGTRCLGILDPEEILWSYRVSPIPNGNIEWTDPQLLELVAAVEATANRLYNFARLINPNESRTAKEIFIAVMIGVDSALVVDVA